MFDYYDRSGFTITRMHSSRECPRLLEPFIRNVYKSSHRILNNIQGSCGRFPCLHLKSFLSETRKKDGYPSIRVYIERASHALKRVLSN